MSSGSTCSGSSLKNLIYTADEEAYEETGSTENHISGNVNYLKNPISCVISRYSSNFMAVCRISFHSKRQEAEIYAGGRTSMYLNIKVVG